jgi:NAD(P)-dependent dehydrogenase (short-subunit alcohol dehydrogenase family)
MTPAGSATAGTATVGTATAGIEAVGIEAVGITTVGIATGAGRGMGKACAAALSDMVDVLLLVDLDAESAAGTAKELAGRRAAPEPFAADVSDPAALAGLAARVAELGRLRAVAHAAGISPTMADWRRVITVDLVGTALLVEALRPLVTESTAMVCFASMAPLLAGVADADADAALDQPLDPRLHDRLSAALGDALQNPGLAYTWAKRGVQRLAQREAAWFGRHGARICSVSPGIIDTPQGRQEADAHASMAALVRLTPLAREGIPEEVAAVTAFLLSDRASFVSGIDVPVDGGLVAAVRTGPRPGESPPRD